ILRLESQPRLAPRSGVDSARRHRRGSGAGRGGGRNLETLTRISRNSQRACCSARACDREARFRSPAMRSVSRILSILVLVLLQGLAQADEPRRELVLQTGHTNAVWNVSLS